jgi:hypothetical protein
VTGLEPILIPAFFLLVGAGITIAVTKFNRLKVASNILKYGPVIKKAYDIVDPILDRNLSKWNGSNIDQAIQLTVEAVSDGTLTPKEVKDISILIAERWLPQKAADKVRQYSKSAYEVPQVLAAKQITEVVNGLVNKKVGISYVKSLLAK